MSGPVYTDPRETGAPQVGDLVVVAIDNAPGCTHLRIEPDRSGAIGVLVCVGRQSSYLWDVHDMGWIHAVRRPTEAELAAYKLSQGVP